MLKGAKGRSRAVATALIFAGLSGAGAAQTAAERRDGIARVSELVNDPDPLMRIANFEMLVKENDSVKTETAIRIALTTNDAMLRGLAFRAYLGGVQRFMADLSIEPALQKRLDQVAQQSDRDRQRAVDAIGGLPALLTTGMRTDVVVEDFDLRSGKGRIRMSFTGFRESFDFQVNGSRLITRTSGLGGRPAACSVEMSPTRDLTIEGFLVCDRTEFGRVALKAPMF